MRNGTKCTNGGTKIQRRGRSCSKKLSGSRPKTVRLPCARCYKTGEATREGKRVRNRNNAKRRTKIFGKDLKIEGQEGFGAFKRDDIDEAHLGTNSADLLSNKDVGGAGQMHSWEKHLKKTCQYG